MRSDLLRFCARAVEAYGDIVQLRLGPARVVLLNDAEAAHRVFVDRSKDYVKTSSARAVGRVLGQGLITSNGDLWRRQRRLVQPVFHREVLGRLVSTMTDAVASMLRDWSVHRAQTTFDVQDEMMRLTLRIIGRTMFSVDIDDSNSQLAKAFSEANEQVHHYVKSFFLLPAWIPTPRNLALRQTLRTLDSLVSRIIREHRTTTRSDLLSMLLSVRDEFSDEAMTDRQLQDEVLTIVAAGHETTAIVLTWCFYLLSTHPDVERRLSAELTHVLGSRTPQLEDLPHLTYTAAVLQEAMRLFPPVWISECKAMVSNDVLGYRIQAGSSVLVFTYGIHRNERYWENPSDFDPDRFSPERAATRPRSTFLPFGAGPRKCVGDSFALMEAQIALAMIIQRYKLKVVPNHRVEIAPLVTLRPKYGLRVTAEPRVNTA
jgi:cytochrome P450